MSSTSVKEKVLEVIKAGQAVMRPRWHFVLRAILFCLGVGMVFLSVIFIISLIVFIVRRDGVAQVMGFGAPGAQAFIMSLPWILIGVAVVFIGMLEIMVRQYSVAYRQPLLLSALAVIGIVAIGGMLVASTPLHPELLQQAERHPAVPGMRLYKRIDNFGYRNVHPGVVDSYTDHGFIIMNHRGERLQVLVVPETRIMANKIAPGDVVVVLGQRGTSTIHAFGVRVVEEPAVQHMRIKRPGPMR